MFAWFAAARIRLRWLLSRSREVAVARFDVPTRQWVQAGAATSVERDQLAFATYNIWFSDYFAQQRWHAIAQLLSLHTPDVIALQEVTPAAAAQLLADPWIRQNCYQAAATGADYGNYGMLLLSRLPIVRAGYTRLPTRLGRGFLWCELMVNGAVLVVCCVHLDSGKAAAHLRARQLARIFRALSADDAVVLGDFNMRDSENARIAPPYIDVWPSLRPHDDGYTEDTSINLMRWDSKNKSRHVRFDRILLKGARWAPEAIDLLGTEPVSSHLPRVFPSDHFGVWCRVARRGLP